MSDRWIHTQDGFTGFDDIIPRCAENGSPSTFTGPDKLESSWSPQFRARVEEAKARIQRGELLDEVREMHGSAVVKTALAYVLPKARVTP